MLDALFAAPVRMEVPRDLQESVLLEDAGETLRRAAERGRWQEASDLLASFLDWLRHHVEREA